MKWSISHFKCSILLWALWLNAEQKSNYDIKDKMDREWREKESGLHSVVVSFKIDSKALLQKCCQIQNP